MPSYSCSEFAVEPLTSSKKHHIEARPAGRVSFLGNWLSRAERCNYHLRPLYDLSLSLLEALRSFGAVEREILQSRCSAPRRSSSRNQSRRITIACLCGGRNGRSVERLGFVEPVAHCGELVGVSRGGLVKERRMGPGVVVIGDPCSDHATGMVEAEGQRFV